MLEFKISDRRFASRQPFVFFTHRCKQGVSIYESFSGVGVRHLNLKPEIGGSPLASALSIDKSYVAEKRQVTTGRSGVGVRRLNLKPESRGSPPTRALSFADLA